MKKGLLLMLAFTLFFAFTAANFADAKPRAGGFKSPKQSYTQTPSKSSTPGSTPSKSDAGTGTKSSTGSKASTPTPNRGFFSGGGLMKGLMIGGLAGLMFGSLFAGMGFMGNFLGLIVNLLAVYVLFRVIRSIVIYFKNRRKPDDQRRY